MAWRRRRKVPARTDRRLRRLPDAELQWQLEVARAPTLIKLHRKTLALGGVPIVVEKRSGVSSRWGWSQQS
jgi:hypothetical protein